MIPEQPGASLVVTDDGTVTGTAEGLWFSCAAKTWAAIEAGLGTLKERPEPRKPWVDIHWIEHASTQVRT